MEYNPHKYDNIFKELTPPTIKILDNYWHNLVFNSDEIVLDIGCGPGHFTLNVILQKLRKDLRHLVAVDISKEMIKVAKAKYSHPLISYKELDFSIDVNETVLKSLLPSDCCKSGFDKVFSFYCLMFIQDQSQVAKNIYVSLRPGGEALLALVATSTANDMIYGLSEIPKWQQYMTDAKQNLSYYYFNKHPVEEFQRHLENAGLNVKVCRMEEISIPFGCAKEFEDFMTGLNFYVDRIPAHLRKYFLEDAMDILKLKKVTSFECTLLIAHAVRPNMGK